jgi:environmental stress-induced protein Ves
LRVIRHTAFRTVPWKNGGGVTHEAVRVPPDGATFRWRLSVAEVAVSGPFSDFSGYRRSMALLEGQGLSLNFADGTSVLLREPGNLVAFDGALSTSCDLVAGPCTDLNLIVANDLPDPGARVVGLVQPLTLACSAGESLLIFAVSGSVAVEPPHGDRPERLGRGDLGVVTGAAPGATTLRSADGAHTAQVFLAKLRDNP